MRNPSHIKKERYLDCTIELYNNKNSIIYNMFELIQVIYISKLFGLKLFTIKYKEYSLAKSSSYIFFYSYFLQYKVRLKKINYMTKVCNI